MLPLAENISGFITLLDGEVNMALLKEIILPNGVSVNYHRIVSVFCVTNVENRIEVCSYINKAGRENEKAYYIEVKETPESDPEITAFMHTEYIICDYDENMSIVSAYEYLKTLPEFEGATDV